MSKSGGELLVECLIKQGVTVSFGVPGESYLAVLDALADVRDQLRLIVTRNEGGAGFMAEAYGKLTGKPGVCFVTRGPGATNASIGVHTAMQNSSPMILFVGQIGRDMREREAFQEINYRAYFGSVAKWVTEIDNADRIPEIVARAFVTATSGRPGPVVVALPEDMLCDQTSAVAAKPVKISSPGVCAKDISSVVHMLNATQRPLMIVGGGGWNDQGRAALHRLAKQADMPVAAAFRSQDLIDNRCPHYVGDTGVGMSAAMRELIVQADLIFAINIRFGEMVTDGWSLMDVPNPQQKLIHSHISDKELGKVYQADIPITSSPDALLEALCDCQISGNWANWRQSARAGFEALLECPKQQGAVDMGEICAWLRQHLQDDAVITNGAGNFAIWPGRFLTYHSQQRLLGPQSGAMGAGLPAAIAAKAHQPSRQVVCFAGDGDFQMNCQELGTAAQEGLMPIVLILNNGMYGTIRMHQEKTYPNRVSGTNIVNPDFVALAKAYNVPGETIHKTSEFFAAFDGLHNQGRGGILELIIDPQDLTPRQKLSEMTDVGLKKLL